MRATITTPLLAALLLACTAAAQELRWRIPHRGAHTFERATTAFELQPPPSRFRPEVVVHDAGGGEPHRWRYLEVAQGGAPQGFERPDFDDSGWRIGASVFGDDGQDGKRTAWKRDVLCVRTTVDLGRKKPKALWLRIDHDDTVRVWLNGELVVAEDRYGRGREYFVTGDALDAWRRGDNVLAAKCVNTGGAQRFDLRLGVFDKLPRGLRGGDDLRQALDEEQKAANKVRDDLFGQFRSPAMLLQGELADEQTHVRQPPNDLRDVAWWVAMDLRCGALGGTAGADLLRLHQWGDLKVRGRATPIDADGWQTITAKVETTKEPSAQKDSKRFVASDVLPYVHYGFEGELKVRRRVEVLEHGARVVEIETDLNGEILRGKGFKEIAGRLNQQESWVLSVTHDNQDTAFRLMVKGALERGVERLREQLGNPDGGILGAQPDDGPNSYNSGRLAIGLLALIKGGLPKDDEVVQRGLDVLRNRTLIDTYSLGNALMCLEAYHAPSSEMSMLRDGTIDRPRRREIPEDDRALMAKWVERLLDNIDTRVDPAYLLRFNYTRGPRFDNSLQQYGLLGLYAAHLCGVDVSPTHWEAAANHLLGVQQDKGERVALRLIDYRDHTRQQFDPDVTITVSQRAASARGWSYEGPKNGGDDAPFWGSMTCAGITGLAICQGALQDHPDLKRQKLQKDADKARADGFAWLAKHMNVRYHPGALTRRFRWFYYYLYSLERAALLSGIAIIQDRDWYFEGAMALVLTQQPNGAWPPELSGDYAIERNAMAILFLKQSTSPVLTGK